MAGLAFGLLYNTLFYPRTLIEYTEAATIGLVLGSSVGAIEQLFLERRLARRSLVEAVLARTTLYAVPVAVTLALVLSIEPATLGSCTYVRCLADYVAGPLFKRDLAFSTAFVFLTAFTAHVILLVGTRNFGRLLLGRYRQPRELRAVFMLVDIRGATSLAERLGHERYSALLRDFFEDVSGVIHRARGEVHQYVGDEIVLVWPAQGRDPRWLECFLSMRAALASSAARYQSEYGAVPEFKAGVHAGPVVVTEVGTLQRAHVYHGDVLNTASRIQDQCNSLGFDLLVSEEALADLSSTDAAGFECVGSIPLRGKAAPTAIYGLRASARAA